MRKWIWGAGIPTLLVAGYVGYWYFLESQLRQFVDDWIADQRAGGVQITHGTITTGGFPLSVHADIPAPGISAASGQESITWQGETLRISFPPWDFLTYRFDSPGEHLVASITADSFAKWSLTARQASGSWSILSGGAGALNLDLESVEVVDALDQRFALRSLTGAIDIASEDAPLEQPRLLASIDIRMLTLPEAMAAPLAPVIEAFKTEMTLYAPILPANLPLLFLILRDYQGRITFSDTELLWSELGVSAEGEFFVDDANYPAGRFPMRIAGYGETIARLEQAGLLGGLEAVGLGAVAGAMARSDGEGPPTVSLEVDLIEGVVKVQDITILRLQPLPVAGAQS